MSGNESAELLAKSLDGQMNALSSLVNQYRPYLLHLAPDKLESAVTPRLDPSDIVQQTCLEACRDFGTFRGTEEGEFVAWIKQILNNNVVNAFRNHVQTQKRTRDREVQLDAGNSENRHPPVAARQSTPSARAMRNEAAAQLQEVLGQLPEEQREAVRLRHLEGWSLQQLAEHFDRSEVAVAGLLKRGMRRLRHLMTKEE